MSIPEFSSINVELSSEVGTIRLNRHETLNAFDAAMISDITAAAAWFDRQNEIKVVVVRSTARAFSSGFHLSQFQATEPIQSAEIGELGRRMIEAVASMRAITVAVVNGHCIGGGVVLAAACDFRYASNDTTFYLPETDLGIPLIWGGIPRLLREIGPLATSEMVLLGKRVTAAEAKLLCLINEVHDSSDMDRAITDVVRALCRRSALVLETTKKQIAVSMNDMGPTDQSFLEQYGMLAALLDDASVESRRAYLEESVLAAGTRKIPASDLRSVNEN